MTYISKRTGKEVDELLDKVERGGTGGGGNSDNNYTDADKALVQTIPNKVSQDEFNETVAGLGEAINDVGTVLSKTKANKEGYYPDMSVGMADKVKGVNKVQEELTLTTKPNGNIVIGNLAGQSKEFMPATPSGDPMHYQYLRAYPLNVNTPRGLQYNEATDRWSYLAEYGGITDLTTEEVSTIFARSGSGMAESDNNSGKYYKASIRTNFIAGTPISAGWGYVNPTSHYLYLQSVIEVAVISPYGVNATCGPKAAAGMFFGCEKLRKVIGKLSLQYATPTEMFKQCILLEDIKVTGIKTNISFADSSLLSKESLLYMINNCASNATFTITLHPDVYAKCQEDGEWYSEVNTALSAAQSDKTTTITLASA